MWLTMIGFGRLGGNRVRRLHRDGTAGGTRQPQSGYPLLSTSGNASGGHAAKSSGDQK